MEMHVLLYTLYMVEMMEVLSEAWVLETEAPDPAVRLNTLDPAAVQSSNPCSTPRVCVGVCVCVFGGWVLRIEGTLLCSLLQTPMGENPDMYLNRFLLWITRTHASDIYSHCGPISHTIRTPLAEDTHTRTPACGVIKHNKVRVRCYTNVNAANLVRSLSSSIRSFWEGLVHNRR